MIKWTPYYASPKVFIMEVFIAVIISSTLSMGSAFTQPNNLSHGAHRFVSNATTFPHVEAARYEQSCVGINKTSAISFSEMNEHERAIIAYSFMNNSTPYAHQKMIKRHKKKLDRSETNTASSSFSELNAGDKAALIHERVNNARAETRQMQARNPHGLYENKEQLAKCVRLSYDPLAPRKGHRTGH